MKPVSITIEDVEYVVYPPTGFDWVETSQLEDFERTCELLRRTTKIGDLYAFATYEQCAKQPLALLLQLEQALAKVLTFDIPDPLSASSPSSGGLSISA